MQFGCPEVMKTTLVQVRDVPEEVVARLKARAESRCQSLAAYLRDLLTREAAMPPVEAVMAGIAAREPVSYTISDLRYSHEPGRCSGTDQRELPTRMARPGVVRVSSLADRVTLLSRIQ